MQACWYKGKWTLNVNTDDPWEDRGVVVLRKRQAVRHISVAPVRFGTCEGAGLREGWLTRRLAHEKGFVVQGRALEIKFS